VQRQAGELIHVSNLFRNPNQGELARRIVGYAGPGRVFFCNSGAEANEALIKLARLHGVQKAGGEEGKCYKIICAKNAFHGRTFGGMSATPQEKIQKGFPSAGAGIRVRRAQQSAELRGPRGRTDGGDLRRDDPGRGRNQPVHAGVSARAAAAVRPAQSAALLDEVQCGIGRTGGFYAYEHAGVTPDAIGMAKGLGGGFPIGSVWVRERCAELFHPGNHGTTFGGTPLACAAALAVLDVIERDGLLEKVRTQQRRPGRGAAAAGRGFSAARARRARPRLPRGHAAHERPGPVSRRRCASAGCSWRRPAATSSGCCRRSTRPG
jgi:acetylornithine/N-succinyldiaminopimelate aminotransferase